MNEGCGSLFHPLNYVPLKKRTNRKKKRLATNFKLKSSFGITSYSGLELGIAWDCPLRIYIFIIILFRVPGNVNRKGEEMTKIKFRKHNFGKIRKYNIAKSGMRCSIVVRLPPSRTRPFIIQLGTYHYTHYTYACIG